MAGITLPYHSYNLIKLFYLDNQVSGYAPEIFRIRNLQNELIFIIFLQSIRTCRMSGQRDSEKLPQGQHRITLLTKRAN